MVRKLIRIHDSLPLLPLKHQLGNLYRHDASQQTDRTVQMTINNIAYELDLNEMIDSTLYYRGSWEPHASATIRDVLEPGMTFLDVGANVGYLLYCRRVWSAIRGASSRLSRLHGHLKAESEHWFERLPEHRGGATCTVRLGRAR